MIPYLRQKKIMDLIYKSEVVSIEILQENLSDISASTLRRDLKKLENEGKIVMLSGGAVKLCLPSDDMPVSVKENLYSDEKQIVAELANNLVEDGDAIYLDSGTTCNMLFELIKKKRITIITSNVSILKTAGDIKAKIILLGGSLNSYLSSVDGALTEDNIKRFNYDKAFLGANGVDAVYGVSTPSMSEAAKKATVLKHSKKIYLLCDSSKFNKTFMSNAFSVDKCIVVSDRYDKTIGKITEMITPEEIE